jgi:hypothetical protein
MAISTTQRACIAFFVWLAACCSAFTQDIGSGKPAVNQDSLVIAIFENSVKEYMKLHNKAKAGAPSLKPTNSAHAINQYQLLLVDNIRAARPDAKQGDIFTPEISKEFKRLIAMTMDGPDAAKIRASLRHAEPVSKIPLQVNAVYPQRVPLQSSPPSVLLNLPPLPTELDYRIVGPDLVLRDVGANMIVDFIPGAIPSS